MRETPDVVDRLQQRLLALPAAQQLTLLALLARELATTASALTPESSRADEPALRDGVLLLQVFAGFQTRISRAMLWRQLRDEVHDQRLIEGLYTVASGRRLLEDAVLQTMERVLRAPLQPTQECPCCGYFTLYDRGGYDICKVCFWEDEYASEFYGQPAPWDTGGGANPIGIDEARANFVKFGAGEERFTSSVRPPLPDELPEASES